MRGYGITVGAVLALLAGLFLLAHGLATHPVAHIAPGLSPAGLLSIPPTEVSR
jgi:hypothetical protein